MMECYTFFQINMLKCFTFVPNKYVEMLYIFPNKYRIPRIQFQVEPTMFEPRLILPLNLKNESRLKHGWFHLKLYSVFRDFWRFE